MERIRLTMAQALVRFLDNQYVELDGVENKFVNGIFGVFGHGCVVGVGQALAQGDHHLTFYQGKNEQNMALAAMAFAKQKNRREIIRLRHRQPHPAAAAPRRHLCLPPARSGAPASGVLRLLRPHGDGCIPRRVPLF